MVQNIMDVKLNKTYYIVNYNQIDVNEMKVINIDHVNYIMEIEYTETGEKDYQPFSFLRQVYENKEQAIDVSRNTFYNEYQPMMKEINTIEDLIIFANSHTVDIEGPARTVLYDKSKEFGFDIHVDLML